MPIKPSATRRPAVVRPAAAHVTYRGNLEIRSAAELAKIANVTHFVGNLTLSIEGRRLALPNLVEVKGGLDLQNDTDIELKSLQRVTQGVTVGGSMTLKRVALARLEQAGGLDVGSMSYPLPKLATLELPRLKHAGIVSSASTGLRTLSLPSLQSVSSLKVTDQKALRTLELPALKQAEFRVDIARNPALHAPDLKRQLLANGLDANKLFTDVK